MPRARLGAPLLRACALSLAAVLPAQATDCDMDQCYFRSSSRYTPNMDEPTTKETSAEACQARCANTTGCEFFTFTQNPAFLPKLIGSCELQGAGSLATQGKPPVLSGPVTFPKCCFEVPLLVYLTVTFGAPAVSFPAASNPGLQCFKGYRIYTENEVLPGGGFGKQEDGAAMTTRFPHSKSNVVVLRQGDSEVFKCVQYPNISEHNYDRMPEWPKAAVYHDWSIHNIPTVYEPRLENVTLPAANNVSQERLQQLAQLGINVAIMADTTYMNSVQGAIDAVREKLPNHTLVGYELIKGAGLDTDMALLIQRKDTGSCTLAFEGSNDLADLALFGSDYGTGYCGFANTHVGIRNELWSYTNNPAWKAGISSKLPHCKRVTCVGHSLGGGLCELFTLCANSNHKGDPDYDALAWEPGEFVMMPEVDPQEYSRLIEKPDEAGRAALRGAAPPPALGLAALAAAAGLAAIGLRTLGAARRYRALALGGDSAGEGRGGPGLLRRGGRGSDAEG